MALFLLKRQQRLNIESKVLFFKCVCIFTNQNKFKKIVKKVLKLELLKWALSVGPTNENAPNEDFDDVPEELDNIDLMS